MYNYDINAIIWVYNKLIMTAYKKDPRGWKKFERIMLSDDFISNIQWARGLSVFSKAAVSAQIMTWFKMPSSYYNVVQALVNGSDTPDKSLVGDYVRLEDKGEDGIVLSLSYDINQQELVRYVKENWTKEIKPLLEARYGKRKRIDDIQRPDFYNRVYYEYTHRDAKKERVIDIATRNGITEPMLYKIVDKLKNTHT